MAYLYHGFHGVVIWKKTFELVDYRVTKLLGGPILPQIDFLSG